MSTEAAEATQPDLFDILSGTAENKQAAVEEEQEKDGTDTPNPDNTIDPEDNQDENQEEGEMSVEALEKKLNKGGELTEDEKAYLEAEGYEIEENEESEDEEEEEEPVFAYDDLLSQIDPEGEYETPQEKDEALRGWIQQEIELGQSLANAFSKAKFLGKIVEEINKGVDPKVAALKHIDIDPTDMPEPGSEEHEAMMRAKWESEQEEKRRESQKKAIEQNFRSSGEEAEKFAQENNLTGEKKQAYFQRINELIGRVHEGKVDKGIYEIVLKGLAYDGDIKRTREEEAKKKFKLQKKKMQAQRRGDGLPKRLGGGDVKEGTRKKYSDPAVQGIDKALAGSQNTDWFGSRK